MPLNIDNKRLYTKYKVICEDDENEDISEIEKLTSEAEHEQRTLNSVKRLSPQIEKLYKHYNNMMDSIDEYNNTIKELPSDEVSAILQVLFDRIKSGKYEYNPEHEEILNNADMGDVDAFAKVFGSRELAILYMIKNRMDMWYDTDTCYIFQTLK